MNDDARFLSMTSFGVTDADLTHLSGMTLETWIDEQIGIPATKHWPTMQAGPDTNRIDAWFRIAITAPDQLRQRVAFALSEIFVTSDVVDTIPGESLAEYYDVLVKGAFGKFRALLGKVALSPAMGRYLAMMANQAPNEAEGIRADENFARELMQLFTVGLYKLNPDGTQKLSHGAPVPTYSLADVTALARTLTGWSFATCTDASFPAAADYKEHWHEPMTAAQAYHDTTEKVIIRGKVIPAGGTAETDLDIALDSLVNHPSCAPFICKQLIQRLVTSDPSPAYVGRVSAVFKDNGAGKHGDLAAVVKTILMDEESLNSAGKLREPLLMLTQLFRAFNAQASNGTHPYQYKLATIGQMPCQAPTVFNFFRPDYVPNGLEQPAPEFQLTTGAWFGYFANELWHRIFDCYVGSGSSEILLDFSQAVNLSGGDPVALVDWLDMLFTGQQLPDTFLSAVTATVSGISNADGGLARAQSALYLIMTSPYYQIGK